MSGQRDGLLDDWNLQSQRLARLEANLILAVDLLTESGARRLFLGRRTRSVGSSCKRLRAATRVFVLNVPVGGR